MADVNIHFAACGRGQSSNNNRDFKHEGIAQKNVSLLELGVDPALILKSMLISTWTPEYRTTDVHVAQQRSSGNH